VDEVLQSNFVIQGGIEGGGSAAEKRVSVINMKLAMVSSLSKWKEKEDPEKKSVQSAGTRKVSRKKRDHPTVAKRSFRALTCLVNVSLVRPCFEGS